MGKTQPEGRALCWNEGIVVGRSSVWRVARHLPRGMRAEHLPVEALARRPEAANGARVKMQRPDRRPQDSVGRRRRRQAEALKGRIGHLR